MKICYIVADYAFDLKFGGAVSHISGFVKGVKELGHEIFLISTSKIDGVAAPGLVIKPPLILRSPISINKILFNYILVNKALDFIVKEQPDFICQRHSIHNFCGLRLSRKTGIPLMLEVNASDVWCEKHWGGKLRLEKLAEYIENTCFKNADHIMGISRQVKKQLVALGVAENKISLNPNGVDAQRFHPRVDGSGMRDKYNLGDKVVVGFVGTFSQYHGIPVLAKAIKPIVRHNPKVHFLMIGTGPLRQEFDKIIQAEGVEGHVTSIDSVPHPQIQDYLAACDILTSPQVQNADGSEYFGSPTKLFEYMAMGKAIVASRAGQIGEILKDGHSAILVEAGNPVMLAQGILNAAADSKLRQSLGQEARKVVLSNYTWKHNALRVINAYQKHLM